MREAVDRCALDLSGTAVLTEAASGAYVVTPVLAAMAGATVFAVTKTTAYGTLEEIAEETIRLAALAGVERQIEILTERRDDVIARADIITNSGHIRPLDRALLSLARPTVVVTLMYEAWEFRASDVDLETCRSRSIPVAGTNERHPHIDVFSYLGIMAVKLLLDAGIAVYRCRVLLLCDNDFEPFIRIGLEQSGAEVDIALSVADATASSYDAVLVALHPRSRAVLDANDAALIARRWPGAIVAQYWGDIARTQLHQAGVPVAPANAPAPGHMAILPSGVGPESIVRLQCGGLKVGEILSAARRSGGSMADSLSALARSEYGTFLTSGGLAPAPQSQRG